MIFEGYTLILGGIETIAIIGLSLAVASTIGTTVTGALASAQSARAERTRQQQIRLQERREEARLVREQQREAARIRTGAVAAGITPGTGTTVEAGITDTASQLNRNLSFLRSDTSLSLEGSRSLSRARQFESVGNIFEQTGRLGTLAATNASRISRLFNPRTTALSGG